jgi:two-component system cell cycle response regulator
VPLGAREHTVTQGRSDVIAGTDGIPDPSGWEDPLTGLDGPDFWRRVLVAEVARSARYGSRLTVVTIELQGLDLLAATWGADVARHTLREAAQGVLRTSRTSDYCARLAASRLGVVLTETDEIAAINFVERVREHAPKKLPRGAESLSFSFGWASPKAGEAAEAVVRRAETRLLAELLG